MEPKYPTPDDIVVDRPRYPWYRHPDFPLLPYWELRPGDAYNTDSFVFGWLFLTVWTLDSPGLELAVVCSVLNGLGFTGTLLYLRWNLVIRCPQWLRDLEERYLDRSRNLPGLQAGYVDPDDDEEYYPRY